MNDTAGKIEAFPVYGLSKAVMHKYTEISAKENPKLMISVVSPGSPRLAGTICALSRPCGAATAELDHHPLPGCTTSCRQRAPHRAEIWRA